MSKKYIPELSDKDLLYKCASELYRNNKAHVDKIMKGDFIDFLVDDVYSISASFEESAEIYKQMFA